MEFQSFFGPMTAMTAAGTQPLGSFLNAVPSLSSLWGRDIPRCDPPTPVPHPCARATVNHPHVPMDALPGGCGA